MGMSLSICVGAYLVIDSKEKVIEYGPKRCNHHPEESFSDFAVCCSVCGGNLNRESSLRNAYWYELFPDEEEKYEDMIHWIIPGGNDNGDTSNFICVGNTDNESDPDRIEHDLECSGNVKITSGMESQFIQNFKANYQEIIEILDKKDVEMRVEFGVVTDYS